MSNKRHRGDIMPGIVQSAPEIVLGMNWDSKMDIWGDWMSWRNAPDTVREIVAIYPTKKSEPGLKLI